MEILLCDDDLESVDCLKEILESNGNFVTTATSGYEGIELMNSNRFDLVVTDYSMAHGDGSVLAEHCKQKHVECIVISGFETTELKNFLPAETVVLGKVEFAESIISISDPITS